MRINSFLPINPGNITDLIKDCNGYAQMLSVVTDFTFDCFYNQQFLTKIKKKYREIEKSFEVPQANTALCNASK